MDLLFSENSDKLSALKANAKKNMTKSSLNLSGHAMFQDPWPQFIRLIKLCSGKERKITWCFKNLEGDKRKKWPAQLSCIV